MHLQAVRKIDHSTLLFIKIEMAFFGLYGLPVYCVLEKLHHAGGRLHLHTGRLVFTEQHDPSITRAVHTGQLIRGT
jgi:hypothetical protein